MFLLAAPGIQSTQGMSLDLLSPCWQQWLLRWLDTARPRQEKEQHAVVISSSQRRANLGSALVTPVLRAGARVEQRGSSCRAESHCVAPVASSNATALWVPGRGLKLKQY